MIPKQKFNHGDLVFITNNLPDSKFHFSKRVFAFVDYSYKQMYGGNVTNGHCYSVLIIESDGRRETRLNGVSWYDEKELILVMRNHKIGFNPEEILQR